MLGIRRKRNGPVDRVKVAGDVGGNLDDGRSFSIKGEVGTVVGAPYRRAGTGEEMIGVRLDNGAIVAVPERALRKE